MQACALSTVSPATLMVWSSLKTVPHFSFPISIIMSSICTPTMHRNSNSNQRIFNSQPIFTAYLDSLPELTPRINFLAEGFHWNLLICTAKYLGSTLKL